MYIVAGLGNPGAKYANTRHNVGFDVIDFLSAEYRIPVQRIRFKAVTGEGMIQGEKVVLVKPQTFMNLSGESIRDIMHFFRLPPANLIVIYDDIDLDVGKLRIRASGSAGTHNGMRNILLRLGTEQFPRLRIGVGRPPAGWKLADYVLSRFTDIERPKVNETIERAALAATAIVRAGTEAAMSRYGG